MRKKLNWVVLALIVMVLTGCVDQLGQLQDLLNLYELTVNIQGEGKVLPTSGKYLPGDIVELNVQPEAGWRFERWDGPNASDVVNNKIPMDSNKTITAVFVVDGNGDGGGDGSVEESVANVKLHLPQSAPGQYFELYIDNDIDPGNGFVAKHKGNCGPDPVFKHSFNVKPGDYYIYAAVDANGNGFHENGPDQGDFVGIYGGSFDNMPEHPNAHLPRNGVADFDLYMQVMENNWEEDNVIVRLNLPYQVEHKKYVIFVDNDMNPENGVVVDYWGEINLNQVIEAKMNVPEGNYYIYAAVDVNGNGFYDDGADVGDFVGFFGGSMDYMPDYPNAYVPHDGMVDFHIDMFVKEHEWNEGNVVVRLNLPYQVDHRKFVVFADTDMDPDNGYVSEYWGETYWSDVIEANMFVPEGNYYIYAAVDANGNGFDANGPDVGDFVGLFGGSMDYMPEYPNAYVPYDGMVDFHIDMFIMQEDWKEENVKVTLELPFPVVDKGYVIAVDDDANPENGVLWDYWGMCDGTDRIERTIPLPPGEYNIYAAVNLNDSDFDGGLHLLVIW